MGIFKKKFSARYFLSSVLLTIGEIITSTIRIDPIETNVVIKLRDTC